MDAVLHYVIVILCIYACLGFFTWLFLYIGPGLIAGGLLEDGFKAFSTLNVLFFLGWPYIWWEIALDGV